MDIEEIIRQCGGPSNISTNSAGTSHSVTVDAVRKWRENGIRDYHWPLVKILSGIEAKEVLKANQELNPSIPPDSALCQDASAI